ncbi:MAG: hypothetical protein DRP83_02375 [Planctomycetota bacterium]|nr:MAG: hypothetical protein DRP83_02375 [Planctomycetota bacterium]
MRRYTEKKLSCAVLRILSNISRRLDEVYPGIVEIRNISSAHITYIIGFTDWEVFETLIRPMLKSSGLDWDASPLTCDCSYGGAMAVFLDIPEPARPTFHTVVVGSSYMNPKKVPSIEDMANKLDDFITILEGERAS